MAYNFASGVTNCDLLISATTLNIGASALSTTTLNATTISAPNCTSISLGTSGSTVTLNGSTIALPNATAISSGASLSSIFAQNISSTSLLLGTTGTITVGSATSTIALNGTTLTATNASVLTLGTSISTMTFQGTTFSFLNSTSLTCSSALANIFATNLLTTNLLTACTALTIGATTGTTTHNSVTHSFPNCTDISCGVNLTNIFTATTSNVVNLLTGSTTIIVGTSGGSFNVNNAVIAFANATSITCNASLGAVFASATGLLVGKTATNATSQTATNATVYTTMKSPMALPALAGTGATLTGATWTGWEANSSIMNGTGYQTCSATGQSTGVAFALTSGSLTITLTAYKINGLITLSHPQFTFDLSSGSGGVAFNLPPELTPINGIITTYILVNAGTNVIATKTVNTGTVRLVFYVDAQSGAFATGVTYTVLASTITYPCASTGYGY